MRIIQLTPGTGSFYCGSCMRDNALVKALIKMGEDALMLPMYLSPILDEGLAFPGSPLFYGGINVYLQQAVPLFRNTPEWVDRLFDSRNALDAAAKRAGMTNPEDLGPLTLSTLKGEEGNQAKELKKLTRWLKNEGKPDVVCLSNIMLIGLAKEIKRQTGATILCTLQGEDYFIDLLLEPHRSDCWRTFTERSVDVDAFIPVSHYYGEVMKRRAKLPANKVFPIHNGILLDGYAPRPTDAPELPPTIGYLARMCGLKGLDTLVDAFLLLRERAGLEKVQLRVAGTKTLADEPFIKAQVDKLTAANALSDAVFRANISREEKISFLQNISVLSVPATYGESFGLYVIEAMAAGVPVVQPNTAAFPEILERTGGGILCEPSSPKALANALEALLRDPQRAKQLGETGRKAVLEQFGVDNMAQAVLNVIHTVSQNQSNTTKP